MGERRYTDGDALFAARMMRYQSEATHRYRADSDSEAIDKAEACRDQWDRMLIARGDGRYHAVPNAPSWGLWTTLALTDVVIAVIPNYHNATVDQHGSP